MPVGPLGQMVTFAVEEDPDTRYSRWVETPVRKGDTVEKIVGRLGHPEDARRVADKNDIRSVRSKLKRHKLKVPGELRASLSFSVLAAAPPKIEDGYAKLGTLDRPGRVGITTFEGYNPISMLVPIQFESWTVRDGGADVEDDIALLERMAGRGKGADASGPPPVIRVSTTGASGNVVPLIPANYQWTLQNQGAPVWRISGIEWDDEPLRSGGGRRLRQGAVVSLQQHTKASLAVRSVAQRAKDKKKKPKPKGKK